MNYDNSWFVTCAVCCVYPLAVHGVLLWLSARARGVDWRNIRLPWKRDQ